MDSPRYVSGHLTHLGVLRVIGADALSFLQGQVSNDTRRLTQGAPLLSAYSTPQGRVLAVLWLLPHPQGALLILPREIAAPLRERLGRFVLRAKVSIHDDSLSCHVAGYHSEAALAAQGLPQPSDITLHAQGITLARLPQDPTRVIAIQSGSPRGDDRASHDWRLADIRAGLPQVYAATQEAFVAQMLNLDLLDAISFSKGCYTGQEIIARTQHLGRIKRRLFRLQLPDGPHAPGEAIRLADGRHGRLVDAVPVDHGSEALAVLNLDAGEASPPLEGEMPTQGTCLPLPYTVT